MTSNDAYWLTDVLLEEGYEEEDGMVVGTKTGLYHLRIERGRIADIVPGDGQPPADLPRYGAKRLLLLPSFKEAHIHLDKTYYGGPWKAVKRAATLFERIEEERELLPKLLPTARERAESILALLLGFGSTRVRTHCNVEPVSGLKRLEATRQALDTFAGRVSGEIVAFPQHGLLRSGSVELVRQAMREGASLVGGVDPHTVDGNVEKSLAAMVDIAVEAGAGIDIHLHDRGEAGKRTLAVLADWTEEAGLRGKVTVSHAFWFAGADAGEAEEMAERLAELGMWIASTVPIGRSSMPLPMLHEKGVNVELATDSLTDHWSPFGIGDNLEKAGRFAELYGYTDELSLSQALRFITGGVTPLSRHGERAWPSVGDEASAVLVQASCSAEAVARRAKRQAVLVRGALVSGTF
ncbi:amidohydrolase [Paenibacillus flagellatus]|uniref:Deaminase n=1 Tax=Paenibacillus flagellatus TaxID=2211139 RepID=A0A2V5KRP7_9BACL|nr:amidohydrolase [Paenibacillus flagellatus]PYI51576.1 deaminase [Paenibacillus flagellatus]